MVGMLMVARGRLGESLIHCASHVRGSRPPYLMQIGVSMHDDPQLVLPQAIKLARSLDHGGGVLVLSDVYGATPCNIASKLLIPGKIEGVAGGEIARLLCALTYLSETPRAVGAGRESSATSGGMPHAPP